MSLEENKALVRRFFEEGWDKNNPDVFDEVCAADFTNPSIPDLSGPALPKQSLARVRASLPDYRCTIEEMIAEGDKVVTHVTHRGTQDGEWEGLPPTGKQVEWQAVAIFRIAEGRIAERANITNMPTVMWQLGVIPPWEEIVEQAKSKQA